MTDTQKSTKNGNSNQSKELLAVDLLQEEAKKIQLDGSDFTETKEALVDALVNMTKSRCIGEHEYGEYVFGTKPSKKFVSGFLLPRFDSEGTDDETNSIHISNMGMDLQITSEENGKIEISPKFSVYVRVLPSWEDISNPKYGMYPSIKLSSEIEKEIVKRTNKIIEENKKDLPPIDEFFDADKEGIKVVNAQKNLEQIESKLNVVADKSEPKNALENFSISQINQNINIIEEQRKRQQKRIESRKAYHKADSEIRKQAYDKVYKDLGIELINDKLGGSRLLNSEDLIGEFEDNTADSDREESESDLDPLNNDQVTIENIGESKVPHRALRQNIGRIEDKYAAAQLIPQKWKRLDIEIGAISFETDNIESVKSAKDEFKIKLRHQLDEVLINWLNTEEGKDTAFRKDEKILPSQFADESSWKNFLSALRKKYDPSLSFIRPNIDEVQHDVELIINIEPDFVDPSRQNLRIAIENGAKNPLKSDLYIFEHTIFQVELTVTLPQTLHKPLRLTRIEASERYKDWLDYPAMGLNCGINQVADSKEKVSIKTTWIPRYTQPRIEPRNIENVPTNYAVLADVATIVESLYALPDSYDKWILEHVSHNDDASNTTGSNKLNERIELDRASYEKESQYIRKGIDVLVMSQQASQKLTNDTQLSSLEIQKLEQASIPWRAWIYTNETFREHGKDKFTDWRLFQLAFILAHIPTLASRMNEFKDLFEYKRDELAASLLYFPTGGGKSEAFFGLLVFNLFLDRLRGKNRGVTALIRYPLRLLTLQQARRLTKLIVCAELIRSQREIGDWPFELGFWVGSGNTPNRVEQGFGSVPSILDANHMDDSNLLEQSNTTNESSGKEPGKYTETLESYDKLCECPCCSRKTGMRRYPNQHNRIGIVCFNDDCDWNRAHSNSEFLIPLPFLFTDDTIYQRAPSVVLGTIDKLALIGQNDHTINSVVGMFGCARYMDPSCQHFFSPRGKKRLIEAEDKGYVRLYPAFSNGKNEFHDPFPSLIIQDEGHLLTESLGTFTGLFETMLEKLLCTLGEGILQGVVATYSPTGDGKLERPRFAKVVAATATISDPDRQLRVLYQRESLRFPCPGVDLYESFFSYPKKSRLSDRNTRYKSSPKHIQPELTSPWMRTYFSIITNGHSHNEAASSVISAYHISFTILWKLLESGNTELFIKKISDALSSEDSLTEFRKNALNNLGETKDTSNLLASLLDLLRTSLTYVSSKKGGDLIIDTLGTRIEKNQIYEGIEDIPFISELISGGVTIAEIQDIMKKVEINEKPDTKFEKIEDTIRNIVATSAISHGVDVEKFNSMFFLGLPTDIAEYIQASSRVGRNHPGFCLLIPSPHSRRDRYVLETHDQFHRFLERMISPPAVQRWADRAIRRVLPSIIQTYLCGIIEQEQFKESDDTDKSKARIITTGRAIYDWVYDLNENYPSAISSLVEFTSDALGLQGRGPQKIGKSSHPEYYKNFIEKNLKIIIDKFDGSDASKLSNYWGEIATDQIQPPMTSLRDIDVGGMILSACCNPNNGKFVHPDCVKQVMKFVRGQRLAVQSDLDADQEIQDSRE